MSNNTGKDLMHYKVTRLGCTVSFNGAVGQMSRTDPKFDAAMKAIAADDMDALAALVLPSYALSTYSDFELEVIDGQLCIDGRKLPDMLTADIMELYHSGLPYAHLTNFWRRLSKNPSTNSVEQLYTFMRRNNLPVTPDGCLAAYKSVRKIGTGTYVSHHDGSFKYELGRPSSEPRENVVDDPTMACGPGLHVGSYEYANDFYARDESSAMLVVIVDPADVVSVPTDLGYVKCRACRLYPVEEVKAPISGRRYTPKIDIEDLDPVDQAIKVADLAGEIIDNQATEWDVKIGNYKYTANRLPFDLDIPDGYRKLLPSEMPKFFRDLTFDTVYRKKVDGAFYYIAKMADKVGTWSYYRS